MPGAKGCAGRASNSSPTKPTRPAGKSTHRKLLLGELYNAAFRIAEIRERPDGRDNDALSAQLREKRVLALEHEVQVEIAHHLAMFRGAQADRNAGEIHRAEVTVSFLHDARIEQVH